MTGQRNETQNAEIPGAHLARRTALKGLGAAGLAAAFIARGLPLARAEVATYRKFTIMAKDYRFELPATVPGGYTEITLKNNGTEPHHAMFMRLNEGKTVSDFMNAAKNKDVGALFSISSSAGGPGSVDAGHESTVILNLTAGQYVVICIVPDAHGMPHYKMGMRAPLTVVGASQTGSSPTAQATVDMMDFSFGDLPKEIPAGKHVWKVINTGQQLHEMILNRLAPGVSFEQVKAMLTAPPPSPPASAADPTATSAPASSAPFVSIAGVAPMSPGGTNWAVLDLKAADYFAICFVPDAKTDAPHFELGMIMPFTVG